MVFDTIDDTLAHRDYGGWYFISDSAIANSGKPFFVPEFADEFEATIAPIVRINRLGKSIPSEFEYRYWEELIPAIHFRSPSLRSKLMAQGLPTDAAVSFDRSVIMSTPIPIKNTDNPLPISLLKNSKVATVWGEESGRQCDIDRFREAVGASLEKVSAHNTIKTGDLLVPGLSKPITIKPGDRLELLVNMKPIMMVAIK